MDYKSLGDTILQEIKAAITLEPHEGDNCSVELNQKRGTELIFTVGPVDRGPRLDHGGGDDGQEWQDHEQEQELKRDFNNKNKHKLDKILAILNKNLGDKWSVRNSFEYGEKGHCSYWICATLNT